MKVKIIASTDIGGLVCGIAARTCISETCPGIDDPEKSMKSLKQALNSHHDSVLEHWSATFAIEGISRACSHQLVRHRVASYSQQSQRYVNMEGFDYVIPVSIDIGSDDVFNEYISLMDSIDKMYRSFIERGIPEEDARYILPNACTTNIVVTMNARELKHFLGLRICNRAQKEIRQLAQLMLECLKDECPELFEDVGPQCKQKGFCPERKGCGLRPTYDELLDREAGR